MLYMALLSCFHTIFLPHHFDHPLFCSIPRSPNNAPSLFLLPFPVTLLPCLLTVDKLDPMHTQTLILIFSLRLNWLFTTITKTLTLQSTIHLLCVWKVWARIWMPCLMKTSLMPRAPRHQTQDIPTSVEMSITGQSPFIGK